MAELVKIRNAHYRLEQAMEAIRTAGATYRQKRDRLQQDRAWSPEGRDEQIAKVRQEALAQIEASRAEVAEARQALADALSKADSEDRSTPVARERVRALLAAGTDAVAIRDRAAQVGDVAMLEALRAEAPWITETGGPGAGTFDHSGFVRSIDLALLPLVDGDDRELRQMIAVDGPRTVEQVEILLDTAGAEIESGPSLSTAVALRFAGAPPESAEGEPPSGTSSSLEEAVSARSGASSSGPA